MDNLIKISERIKKRRTELGFSYHELSKKTGISASTLQRYETGHIKNLPVEKFEIIAKALKIDPVELMGISKTNNDPISQLTKKEKFEYDKFMEDAIYYFNNETVSDEDKKKLSDALQNAFITALMEKNKRKKKK